MCGIAGFRVLSPRGADAVGRDPAGLARAMADCLVHRGPDAGGAWVDADGGVAFGHRRLAVVDLTATGAQPMTSADGRMTVTYNGELYATEGLRADLAAAGARLAGTSDTEVLVEACARFGVDAVLPRLTGMFAFALWDRAERRLTLARDRVGIKPLVWARVGDAVVFASDLTALRRFPGAPTAVDRDALATYLMLGHVPAPRTIHPGVRKVVPGTTVTVEADGRVTERAWWSLEQVVLAARADGVTGTSADPRGDAELVDAAEAVLSDAVAVRMLADVPLGALLSGGIDSSTVVALMQARSRTPVRTFSIGSPDAATDEARFARAVANHLGTEHTELVVGPDEARATLPELAGLADEPFADASLLPTLLVSRLARRDVTVALSGDGGDEVFGGYVRHLVAAGALARAQRLPAPVRRAVAGTVAVLPPRLLQRAGRMVPSGLRGRLAGESIGRVAGALDDGPDAAYHRFLRVWDDAERLVPGASRPVARTVPPSLAALSGLDRMRWLDTVGYLPDDILTKVDRASMAVSLEARVPILDHRVVAFAWGLPERALVRDGVGKWVLREVLARHVPTALTDRPKRGFSVPIGAWLAGPLRDWAEGLLAPAALAADDLLDPAPVRARWAEHLAGGRDHGGELWAVLALQAWRASVASGR